MTDPATERLEQILRQCAQAAPHPWYPRAYAEATGTPRDALDAPLERLRMRGLIRLTEWEPGDGQGYALTPEGERVLKSPRLLAQLRAGHLPQGPAADDHEGHRRRPGMTTYDRGEAIRAALLGQSRPVVTYTLIALNVLVFLASVVLSQRQQPPLRLEDVAMARTEPVLNILHQLGAVRGGDILEGQWWRLVACCFVHFGLLHLGVNMYSLYVVGPLLERMWGPVRFLALYLIAGLGGSCVAMIATPYAILAGASGALWGVLASMAVWVWLNRGFLPPPLVSTWMRQLLFIFVLNVGVSFVPGISKEAHFGGGTIGAVAGVLLNWQRFGSRRARWLSVIGLLAIPLLCLGALQVAPALNSQWARLVLRAAGQREEEAIDAANDTEKDALLRQNATRRNPAQVEKTVAALGQARARLAAAIQLLRGPVPFRYAGGLENFRVAYRDYLATLARLFELQEDALLGKPDATERALAEQLRRYHEARKTVEGLLPE
jgi:membrane associated rhomboid family serine protease